jgi:hypothetical protein
MEASFHEEKVILQKILKALICDPNSGPFIHAIEEEVWQDYIKFIKKPIYLMLIDNKLKNDEYLCAREFFEDLQLIWDNCKFYNQDTSEIFKQADLLEKKTEELIITFNYEVPTKSIIIFI